MKRLVRLAVAMSSVLLCTDAVPHHGFYGVYVLDERIDFTGSVVAIEWVNPHAFVLVQTELDGAETVVRVELQSLNQLSRKGWQGDELGVGERVVVTNAAFQIEGDSALVCCARIHDLDGKEFFTDPRPDRPR